MRSFNKVIITSVSLLASSILCQAQMHTAFQQTKLNRDLLREQVHNTIAGTQERQEAILRKSLDNPFPKTGAWREAWVAFGAYYFDEKIEAAEEGILRVQQQYLQEVPESSHWHVYLLARLYWMYSSKGADPKMSPATEDAILKVLSLSLKDKGEYAVDRHMADPSFIWTYKGSENHHLMFYVSTWSAAHILSRSKDYSRFEVNGVPMHTLAKNLDEYFKLYLKEKATKGLLTEIATPTYAKYSLNVLYNLYDFSSDPELKQLTDNFLNLYFADWAIEQFRGFRGGSKHRAYKGVASMTLKESTGWIPFGLGVESCHPGFMAAATTEWRPNPLIVELALSSESRGQYAVSSRRPGLRTANAKSDSECSPEGGELLRYTYQTPQFNMGMSMVPALKSDAWVPVSSQNRLNQILFSGHPLDKIFTQRPVLDKGSTYNAEWGVQDKGVMILQALNTPYSKSVHGQYIYFSVLLDPIKKNEWWFVESSDAYCAIKIVKGGATLREPTKADDRYSKTPPYGLYLVLEDPFSPIIFEAIAKENYSSIEAFQEEIFSNKLLSKSRSIEYYSRAYNNHLTLYSDYSQLPKINGETINLNPPFVYQSPFINAAFGGDSVNISVGDRELNLNF